MRSASEKRGQAAAHLHRAIALATLPVLALLLAPSAPSADAAFGFSHVDLTVTDQEGTAGAQAGSHPYALDTTLAYSREIHPTFGEILSGQPRDLRIQLPPGLLGQAAATPSCPREDFATFLAGEVSLPACPDSSAIGFATVEVALPERGTAGVPIFNLAPLPGNLARFGFGARNFSFAFNLDLSDISPYRLAIESSAISQQVSLLSATVTIWGDPSNPAHDAQRGRCGAFVEREGIRLEAAPGSTCPTERDKPPFLTLPRSCVPATTIFEAASWAAPTAWVSSTAPAPLAPTGCGALPYSPTLTVKPTTTAAAAPSGLDLDLDAPDEGIGSPTGTAHADTAAATLALPAGLTVNPPVAAGLAACSPAELARETPTSAPGEGCPQAAKIGTASVTTPLFSKLIAGALYVAQPDERATPEPGAENPFDSLLALYLVLRDPERGVLMRLPIRLDADPETGRLSASFDQIPPLPLSHLALRFNSGPPLATPPGCGSHAIGYSLRPSSGSPPLAGSQSFATSSNCPAPFAPSLAAGTASYAAGSAAPFVLELANPAAAPNLSSLHLTLPPGLAADLTAASTCPEADVAAASCPPASRVGYARIGLGTGAEPLWVPGGAEPSSSVYLAGPDRGAPYSLLISVPAAAGPYDLGRVLLRAPVHIDPFTVQATVEVADLPQVREGIPLRYRAIRLVLDRPGFIRNPTSCEPTRLTATATAAGGAIAALQSRFQAADCAALAFRPALDVRFSNPARNAHPRIAVELRPRPGDANLAAATFTLPAGELLDLRRVRALCNRELAPESCPAGSRLGRAVLASPLLRGPLAGPVYLRRPSGGLPDLVAELRGEGLRFVLRGHTAAPAGRLRVSFPALPDIPLSQARFTFAGARRGIFVNSQTLCTRPLRALAGFRGHNGRHRRLRPEVSLRGPC